MLDESKSSGDVVGDDASAEAVVGVVGAVYHLLEGLELEDALHRPEDLNEQKESEKLILGF